MEDQIHRSSKSVRQIFHWSSEFFRDVRAELSVTTHQLPVRARKSLHPALYHASCGVATCLCNACPKELYWKLSGRWANGPSIVYYFIEIMVVSFVNLTQNAAGRCLRGKKHYDQ